MDLKGRHLLKLLDFTPEEILYLVDHADELKAKKKQGIPTLNHPGKNIALIFEKNSTRTRCSFEVAANDLGMHTTFLDPSASQIGNGCYILRSNRFTDWQEGKHCRYSTCTWTYL